MKCEATDAGENSKGITDLFLVCEETGIRKKRAVFYAALFKFRENGNHSDRAAEERWQREMLKWHEHYYVSEDVRNPEKIRNRLDENKAVPGIYLLTLSDHRDHLMELVPALMLKQGWIRENCPLIFGMAAGKEDAMELTSQILKEIYEKTGAFDVEDYLKNR